MRAPTAIEIRVRARFLEWWREETDLGREPGWREFLERFPHLADFSDWFAEEHATLQDASLAPDQRQFTIDRFEVQRRLGRGGQGQVYLAYDPDLKRQVAIKVLTHYDLNAEARARLAREASSLARIDSPGIATVHEVHLEATPPYLVMRYVPGRSLQAILSEGRDSPIDEAPPEHPNDRSEDIRRTVQAGLECARVLQAVHGAGIVHRDIKPDNILITPGGSAVVVDFGLAKDLNPLETSLTETGLHPGTLPYMAPEQLESETPDPRTDVWALGVSLYEALTLEHPFGPAGIGISAAAFAQKLRAYRPRLASAVTPGLPRALALVLDRAIETDAGRRYASAGELADDLERFLQGQPVSVRGPSPGERMGRLLVRRRRAAMALAGVLVLGLVIQLVNGLRVTRAREGEVRNEISVIEAMRWLSSEVDMEISTKSHLKGPDGLSRAERMTRQLMEVAEQHGANDAGPGSRLELRLMRASLANAQEDFHLTRALLSQEELENRPNLERPQLRAYLFLLAHALRETGEDEASLTACDRLLDLEPENANLWINRGNLLSTLGRTEEALESYERGIERNPKAHWARQSRGILRSQLNDTQGALEDFEAAFRLEPNNRLNCFNYAASLLNAKQERLALEPASRLVALSSGEPRALELRAKCYYNLADFEPACADLDRAFALWSEIPLPSYQLRMLAGHGLGRAGQVLEDAQRYLDQVPGAPLALEMRGWAHARLGDAESGLADLTASIEAGGGATAWNQRGLLLLHLERYEEGLADLDRARELGHHSDTLESNRAFALEKLGRTAEGTAPPGDETGEKP